MSTPRIKELEGLIKKARHFYYNGQPEVSDETFDAWADELAGLEAQNAVLAMVGAPPVSEWAKASHGIPMGSLDKVNTLEEMTRWMATACPGEAVLVTEKLDGISGHLRYVEGKLVQAITRGDGIIGEDITQNVLKMKGVPSKLPSKFTGSIRGEILLLRSDHKKHFPEYSNPRNAASGLSKRYDGKGSEHLSVITYQVVDGDLEFASWEEQFKFLASQGFLVPTWSLSALKPGTKTPHDIWAEYQQTKRDLLDYDIDGLVIYVNDLVKYHALGEKDLRPKGAIAFKFKAIARETVIRGFEWQTGGTGRMTPVASFDTVTLIGAQVSNATVYNLKNIRDLQLDVGARVLVVRANDVIPKIVALVQGTGKTHEPPTACTTCGGGVVEDGEYLVCSNTSDCPAQVTGRLGAWIRELNVLDFGEGLLDKLVTAGLVKQVPDLYRLTVAQIAGLDRLGEKTATKVLANLQAKSPVALESFLGGLSIPMVATSTIKALSVVGLDTLAKIRAASEDKLEATPGLGPIKAKSLYTWMQKHSDLIDDLASVLAIKEKIVGGLTGKSFCFTGSSTRTRAELEGLVLAAGGEVKASVTKKLTYLVMADPNSVTSKATAAKKNGTECISEEHFVKMAGV